MEHSYDKNRRLADYMYNDLSPEARVEFEMELSDDPRLSAYYELNTQVKEYLQAKIQLEEMKSDPMLEDAEKLADLAFQTESGMHEDRETISISRKSNRVRNWSIITAMAAGLAILITIGIQLQTSPDSDHCTYNLPVFYFYRSYAP